MAINYFIKGKIIILKLNYRVLNIKICHSFSNKLKNKVNSMNWDRESTKHSEWKSNNNGKIMENANQRTRNYENDISGSIWCSRLPPNLSRQKRNNVHLPTNYLS